MPNSCLKSVWSFTASTRKLNAIKMFALATFALIMSGCGGGSGQSFSAPSAASAINSSLSSVQMSSVGNSQSSSINNSSINSASVNSSSPSSSPSSSSSSLKSNSSNNSSAVISFANSLSSLVSNSNSSSSSLQLSSLLSSSVKTSSSLNSISSSASTTTNSSAYSSSLSSSSQASSVFTLTDIHFKLQSPANNVSDIAIPAFGISNLDAGDLIAIFSTDQCNTTDEFARGIASSNSMTLPIARQLSFGVYTFYISVKKSGQSTSICLPLNVGYTFIPSTSAYINVKDYGAKGDGVNDDTQAINTAFVAAKTAGKSIYFPAGTYVCNEKSTPDNKSLVLNAGGLNNIAIFGDGNVSHITSSISTKVTLLYIYAYAKSANLHIFNLKFSNTHSPAPAEYQYGLFLQGTGAQNFANIRVANTTFSGFGGALQGQGISGLEINHNIFLSPRGHDESVFGSSPAVYIWLFENANGLCENVKIHHNLADGFSSNAALSSTVSKRAMDGFFVGYAYGMELYKNTTQNFIEEHYIFTFPVMIPTTQATINIHDNFMNAAIKAGSLLDNGNAKKSNYGIRSDATHVTIENNAIIDYTLGILVRTIDNPAIAAKDIVIKNNQLSSAKDSNAYTMSSAIYVVGNSTYPIDNLDISHNVITMNISPALQIYSAFLISNTVNSNIHDNEVQQGFVNFSSNQLIGRNYSKVTNITDSHNSIQGNDILPYKKLVGDTINFQ
jgi:hypothetical protein